MKRLFIDECLSASLAARAKERGIAADYGPYIGMAGYQDWNIARFAFENDYIVVTNNRRHFLREYARYELHAGLVVIVPQLGQAGQVRLFDRLLDQLAEAPDDLVNRLIELLADASLHVREWTLQQHDPSHITAPSW